MLGYFCAFLTGVFVVISRTTNAKLAEKTSAATSMLFNYIFAFVFSFILFFVVNEKTICAPVDTKIWVYFGGTLGVIIGLMCNILANKMPTFIMTIIVFIGQIFMSVVLDIFVLQKFNFISLVGIILISVGLIINTLVDENVDKKRRCR